MSEGSGETGQSNNLRGSSPVLNKEEVLAVEKRFIDAGIVTKEGLEKSRQTREMLERGETPPEHILPESAPPLELLESVIEAHGGGRFADSLGNLPAEERRFRMYQLSTGLFNDNILRDELGIEPDSLRQSST